MSTLESLVAVRISDQVPALQGRVDDIAVFAALVEAGALPEHEVCAFVAPLGLDASAGQSAVNVHTQSFEETIAVIIAVKARGDVKAKKALPTIGQLKDDVMNAVTGWAPNNNVGVFNLRRGRLLSALKGLVVYQLEFALLDQLRIVS
ncbi:hypothetical protein [Bradyrhizobium sp. BR 10289]|uniref:phage tail terminator protein n=1 Tax=Bradyrhizobium sp. BR 10289 TaxID=2749993 RepID=UPI001C64B459|nr:hypothetical protein [Bradyrhizobium sp. BR 10289]MBW7968119.1 hypothetical protein [Bradyrhizobium sp. BR 10289]